MTLSLWWGSVPTTRGAEKALSAAFVYVEPIGETGWTYQHEQGRQCLAKHGIRTAYVESMWNWCPFYLQAVDMVRHGRFKAGEFYGGLADGTVSLSPLHAVVPEPVRRLVETKRQALIEGTFDYWQGPLQDTNGKIVVATGSTVTLTQIHPMHWLLTNIVGTIP